MYLAWAQQYILIDLSGKKNTEMLFFNIVFFSIESDNKS